MNRVTYLEKKTFVRYDEKRVMVYLNEEVTEKFVPEDAPKDFVPCKGYSYSGECADGGTLIEAADDSRDSLINGIIRSRYSQTEEDAIKTHQLMIMQMPAKGSADVKDWTKYDSEWAAFLVERENAIKTVDKWLGLDADNQHTI